MNILLVDDDAQLGALLARVIIRLGHNVVLASSYAEAIQKANEDVQVVLTDYHLDGMMTAQDVIRNIDTDAPFILMSGDLKKVPYSFREKAFAAVDKPVVPAEIRALLRELDSRAA